MFSTKFLCNIRKIGKVTIANENKSRGINRDTRVFSDSVLIKK